MVQRCQGHAVPMERAGLGSHGPGWASALCSPILAAVWGACSGAHRSAPPSSQPWGGPALWVAGVS